MINITYGPGFDRIYKKKIRNNPQLADLFKSKIGLFMIDPFNPQLRTHKLTGKLHDYWAFRLEYDLRIVFYFEDANRVVLVDFGTHNDVY